MEGAREISRRSYLLCFGRRRSSTRAPAKRIDFARMPCFYVEGLIKIFERKVRDMVFYY